MKDLFLILFFAGIAWLVWSAFTKKSLPPEQNSEFPPKHEPPQKEDREARHLRNTLQFAQDKHRVLSKKQHEQDAWQQRFYYVHDGRNAWYSTWIQRYFDGCIHSSLSSAKRLRCKQSGEPKTLFFNLSGHGHFDMAAYDKYFAGELEDFAYPEEALKASLANLPKVTV